ncbi:MAG: gluconate 2-dehydrogenase subunit 3 family protein [Sphingomonadaceae bacterium]|nr:gluconate 2-dehydrogenase subunit 3 family protein [Sphingomonadaceae bacterium]
MADQPMPATTRRGALAALGLMPFLFDGTLREATAAEAKAGGAAYRVLNAGEVRALEAFGEVLLPGARAAGVAHYVDAQLARPPADSLLMLRYLDVPPPYDGFYKAGLAALDKHAGGSFAAFAPDKAAELVRALSAAPAPDWAGPPSPLFYFAVRADAVDVIYGTMAGFAKLGIPYMAHIEPSAPW